MKSMNGFAKKQCEIEGHKLSIEIKTLNSKQLDINVKLPFAYREKELEIRTMLNQLERGKIDFLLVEETTTANAAQLNTELAKNRYTELLTLNQELQQPCEPQHLLRTVMAQPDVWSTYNQEAMSDEFWTALSSNINEAIIEVDTFRKQEGEILKIDFIKHVDLIEQKLNEIPQYESERIDTAKDRIHKYINDFQIKEIDQNRFEQEMIYYLEKLDITEEKIRLAKHIDYFRDTMNNEEGSGKKLGFVAQEMGREINTTGSKANHVKIQQLVVEMKDELEKIKEQLGNIL